MQEKTYIEDLEPKDSTLDLTQLSSEKYLLTPFTFTLINIRCVCSQKDKLQLKHQLLQLFLQVESQDQTLGSSPIQLTTLRPSCSLKICPKSDIEVLCTVPKHNIGRKDIKPFSKDLE